MRKFENEIIIFEYKRALILAFYTSFLTIKITFVNSATQIPKFIFYPKTVLDTGFKEIIIIELTTPNWSLRYIYFCIEKGLKSLMVLLT